jgi:small subunit ribosomal protein S4e
LNRSHHLKRLNAPRILRLHRKEHTWTVRTAPGPHGLDKAIPLGIIIRDYLNLCDIRKEAKRVLAENQVLVDGKIRKDYKFPVGLMDVVSIPTMKKQFRMLYDQRGKLTLVPITPADASWKLRRIENKTILKGKKTQLNFHDGYNMIVENDEYETGDVLQIKFEDTSIMNRFSKEKGVVSLIIGGTHVGELANIDHIEIIPSSSHNLALMKGAHEFTTIEPYVFPVGKTKPVIAIPEVKVQ